MKQAEPDRQNRLLWIAFVGLALVAPFLIAYDIYYQVRTPVIDFDLDWQTGVVLHVPAESFANTAGLMAGDVITRVDGTPFARWKALAVKNYALEIERGRALLVLELPVVPLARINAMRLISMIVVVSIFWLFSILLLLHRSREELAQLIFLQGQVLAITVTYPLAHPGPWDSPPGPLHLSLVGFYFLAPVTLHLHATFPERLGTPRQRRWGVALLYLFALVCMTGWLSGSPVARGVGEFAMIVVLAAALLLLVYAYFRRATPDGRRRVRIVWFGTMLAMLPTSLFFFIPGLYRWPFQMPVWLVSVLLMAVPLSYVYAITRQNLFGLDRLLNRATVYGLLSLGIMALYIGPFLLIYRLAPGDVLAQAMVAAGLTLLVGLAFGWTREQAQRLVDRLFYGGWYDYPGVVEAISDALARSITRQQVSDVLTQQVPALMQLKASHLWLGGPDDTPLAAGGSPDWRLVLQLQGQHRAIWTVGQHTDGEDYTEADRRIFHTLAHQAQVALNNVLLVEALRQQLDEISASRETLAQAQRQLLRSREAERARLAREIHDGPLQVLVGMNLQLGMMLNEQPPEASSSTLTAMQQEVHSLLSDLRQVCAELRPPMLDTLGLGVALRTLVNDWSLQSGISVDLNLSTNAVFRILPEDVALNLYRVTQEALSNIARHAVAHQVNLRLTWEKNHLTLVIRDDGRGFAMPDTLHGLPAKGHFGLVGIRERVELIGGKLSITSAPGKGTMIQVSWP